MASVSLLLFMVAAVAANIIIIIAKFKRNRTFEAVLDLALLIAVAVVFMSSFNALVVGTFASLIISVYLWLDPPKLPDLSNLI